MARALGGVWLAGLTAASVLRAGSALAAPPAIDVPGQEPKVTVIVDEPVNSRLMRENAYGWGSVCTAPCTARLPRNESFVVDVPGTRRTGRLDLEHSPEAVRLHLTPPTQASLIAGTLLVYFGGTFASTGLLVALAGLGIGNKTVTMAGAVVGGAGAVGLGIGIPLILTNSHTAVEQLPVAQGLRVTGNF